MMSRSNNNGVRFWRQVPTKMTPAYVSLWRHITRSGYDVNNITFFDTDTVGRCRVRVECFSIKLENTPIKVFTIFDTEFLQSFKEILRLKKKNKEHRKCSIFLSKEYITQEYRVSLYFLNVLNLQNRTTVRFSTFVNSLKALFCFQLNKTLKLWIQTAYANKYKKQTGQKISREERIKCHF